MHGKGAFPCVGEHSHRHFVRGGRDWIDWMAFISMVLTFFHCVFGPTFGHQRRKRGNLATRQIGCDMDVEWTQTPANLTAARPPDRGFFFFTACLSPLWVSSFFLQLGGRRVLLIKAGCDRRVGRVPGWTDHPSSMTGQR